jgi:sugar phosphate isomerase/epimerase
MQTHHRTWIGSRRQFGYLTLGTMAAAAMRSARLAAIDTTIGGVRVGAISYCFRSIPRPSGGDYMDTIIDAFRQTGLGICELESARVEPEPAIAGGGRIPPTITSEYTQRRDELRDWRLTVPMDRFSEIRTKFQRAGIELFGYVFTFAEDATDQEIDRTFLAAKTLGVHVIGTNQTRIPLGRRLASYADKYDIDVSWHNHAMVENPDEVASVDSFKHLFSMSKRFKANLDIGHFVAGNNDPVAFIRQYHERITHLHLKDRRRNNGPNQPWGQGETPVAETLRLLQKEKYPITAVIEYEYMGAAPAIQEVKNCVEFIRTTLKV